MNSHEYQAKEILGKHGIPIPPFFVAKSKQEVADIVQRENLHQAIVKIQVYAGGRGKAGGVKFAKSKEEILSYGAKLLGMKMVNQQTGPQGVVASAILLSEPVEIAKEYYLSIIIDREKGVPTLIASQEGGMEIEEVAERSPEKILTLPLEIDGHVRGYQHLRIAKMMGWEGEVAKEGAMIVSKLAKAFIEADASLIEINPLVLTKGGHLTAVDAKCAIDDNALFRHRDFAALVDESQISPQEVAAKEHDLAYIAMDGEIGCMVNGAGLAMATMDIIQLYGGKPANFLDVGGSATKEKVAAGFRIILSDPQVKAILVNIFGGIMNCETIAEGVIFAALELSIEVPLIVRLEGTHAELGRKRFRESGLAIIGSCDLKEAAKKAVDAVKG